MSSQVGRYCKYTGDNSPHFFSFLTFWNFVLLSFSLLAGLFYTFYVLGLCPYAISKEIYLSKRIWVITKFQSMVMQSFYASWAISILLWLLEMNFTDANVTLHLF
jgi:hypothetical protein